MSRKGTIKFYSPTRCYGFVIDEESGAEFFFAPNDFSEHLSKGDEVLYDLANGRKGLKATNIVKVEKYGKK